MRMYEYITIYRLIFLLTRQNQIEFLLTRPKSQVIVLLTRQQSPDVFTE